MGPARCRRRSFGAYTAEPLRRSALTWGWRAVQKFHELAQLGCPSLLIVLIVRLGPEAGLSELEKGAAKPKKAPDTSRTRPTTGGNTRKEKTEE